MISHREQRLGITQTKQLVSYHLLKEELNESPWFAGSRSE